VKVLVYPFQQAVRESSLCRQGLVLLWLVRGPQSVRSSRPEALEQRLQLSRRQEGQGLPRMKLQQGPPQLVPVPLLPPPLLLQWLLSPPLLLLVQAVLQEVS
jgi:hypothetical protein